MVVSRAGPNRCTANSRTPHQNKPTTMVLTPNHSGFLRQITSKRFNASQLREVLYGKRKQQRKPVQPKQYITGVFHGNFYRIKIPKKKVPVIPKLHTPTSAPMRLKTVTRHPESDPRSTWWNILKRWMKKNSAILVLNFGSICTLIGFTRSDVLELRVLSVSGSVCAVVYHIFTLPMRWTPIAWSALFAAVNSFKIFEIIQERQGSVNLTAEQEQRYTEFFMQHGITPKQFEKIDGCAKILHVEKNQVIIRQGETIQHVYLIVEGQTRASVLGRFLTAASFRPIASSKQQPTRGNTSGSGAWIGEMNLLERVWNEEVTHRATPQRKLSEHVHGNDCKLPRDAKISTKASNQSANDHESSLVTKSASKESTKPSDNAGDTSTPRSTMTAMYTIVAQDDCTVLVWSHADMMALMARSPDMKAALTRAMTAAIVGKVVTFTASRSSGTKPNWLSSWLNDSNMESTAASIREEEKKPAIDVDALVVDDDNEAPADQENLPRYPVRTFK